ncbi:hypothetical protein RN70_09690 [Staphylococcus schleiferi]|uniref:hypothetical protein n=1 Tax=Staphylococcus coagulans TaxID=74706 RepID=UPI00067A3895|nr:hypothetical protein NP71_09430 [Staphylococcus schleiferi]AKS74151.1 hypothetical protein RN70_09690 [Staphylococcus schleiferi]
MYKQIFTFDGTPYLLEADEYGRPLASHLKEYGIEDFTDKVPDSNLYWPIYFDEDISEWVGTDKAEFEENNKPAEQELSPKDLLIGELTAQIAVQDEELKQLKAITGDLSINLAEIKGEMSDELQ